MMKYFSNGGAQKVNETEHQFYLMLSRMSIVESFMFKRPVI